jgi:hypothetical protein
MNISVSRQSSPSLTHLIELTDDKAESSVNVLKDFLDSQPHHIQWELRVL